MSSSSNSGYDVLVVGAGFAGSVMAERFASQLGRRVLVIDRRDHVGGNAHDELDEHGVLVHRHGPHIFHTNAAPIVAYLSRFTDWRPYEHRVLADVDGKLLPIPINRDTLNRLYGLDLRTEADAAAFYAEHAEAHDPIRNSEDVVVAKVGRDLYERFFRGYTRKQWQRDPSELNPSVCGRIPTRTNVDDRYFTDSFQQMPADGYTAMFERMLAHPLIEVRTATDLAEVRGAVAYDQMIYTGAIDAYFDHRLGALPYRSLEFELVNHPTPDGGLLQSVASHNHPSEDVPYTRVTEYRHLTGQRHSSSTLAYEYPCSEGPPYYPVPSDQSRALYKRYEALAAGESGVVFVGRLARYMYLNMDQVVGQALATFGRVTGARESAAAPTA